MQNKLFSQLALYSLAKIMTKEHFRKVCKRLYKRYAGSYTDVLPKGFKPLGESGSLNKPLPPGTTKEQAFKEARDTIKAHPETKDKVKQRLTDWGFDASTL